MTPATNAPIVSIEVGGSGTQTASFDGDKPRFANGIDVHGGARVGIAVPGEIDPVSKRVVAASTLGWVDIGPADALGLQFEPEVVCNDAAAAALGEWALRGGRDDRLVYVGLGTGIGGAAVDRGAIDRENLFGHQRRFSDHACPCGQIGCLETVAAGWALPNPLDGITVRRVASATARALREAAAASRGVIVIGGGMSTRYPDLVTAIARDLPGRTVVPSSTPPDAKSAAAWGVRHLVARHRFGIDLRVHPDPAACAVDVANLFEQVIGHSAAPTIAVDTGSPPLAAYAELGRRRPDVRHATFYLLDEYIGLASNDSHRNLATVRHVLGDLLRVANDQVRAPDVGAADVDRAAAEYESVLASHGRPDLAILGIADNGGIALNEPGTHFDSTTRVVDLTESTRLANDWFFTPPDEVPRRAITQGIATIMGARAVLLIATGEAKAPAVRTMLHDEIAPASPASALRRHPNAIVVADRAAANDSL